MCVRVCARVRVFGCVFVRARDRDRERERECESSDDASVARCEFML